MKIQFTEDAEKQFLKLPKSAQGKIERKINLLKPQPFSGKKLSGEYEDKRSLRAWPYRIIYIFNTKQEKVIVVSILHRQGAYK